MNKGNHISLIIFDMDGLMFDTERLADAVKINASFWKIQKME